MNPITALIFAGSWIGSSNKRAIEKASAENTAAIADLKREIVRLNGGTVEPERTFHPRDPDWYIVKTPKPATTAEIAKGIIVFVLLFAILYYFVSHP